MSPHRARFSSSFATALALALALTLLFLFFATTYRRPQINWLNKILHGYLKYGLPLWLTEFACGDETTKMNAPAQASYLSSAMKLLELHPGVARYAW